ncbi:MAG: UDP-N-acetylmuramate dehydrogenase [Lachnospiraceae bacterium]|nr:UDP-N-acetylmuramate dehydrogenase [Lachnospiraceae bacterium]
MDIFYHKLTEKLGEEAVLRDEPLSRHTSFKIGGPARYFIDVCDAEDIKYTVSLCREMNVPFAILGNGSNLLVSDEGYDGAIICLAKGMREVKAEGERIYAKAGALLSVIAREAQKNSLTGFEFAGGIPGTLGGAVVMNAGAYGGEMVQVIESVDVITKDGDYVTLRNEELGFGYRTSVVPAKEYIVIGATIKLTKAEDKEAIMDTMKELLAKRKAKQPLEYPSAGSTFKRPEGYFAAKLIEDAGLKGFGIGGAYVSEKHSGFVVNKGKATAKDVLMVIEHVQKEVWNQFEVKLEPEVKMLGFN